MQGLADTVQEDYSFEVTQEVRKKMTRTDNIHELIPEDCVRDLKPVDITGKCYCKVKRFLDAVLSAMALFVLLIPMAFIAVLVYIDNPGPVVFSQYRVGRYGKCFKLYKFRTMKLETPKYLATAELENPDQYITRIGYYLRKYSLDEIPQLFNVMKGDMSLVGPRPLISDEYEIHAMRMRFGVYNVRPGVTGLAQINGRDRVTPAEKVRMDEEYLRKFSLATDLKILIGTITKILDGHDVVEGANRNK